MVLEKKTYIVHYKKEPVPSLHLKDEQPAIKGSKIFIASSYSTNKFVCVESSFESRDLIWNTHAKHSPKPVLKVLLPPEEALDLKILRA